MQLRAWFSSTPPKKTVVEGYPNGVFTCFKEISNLLDVSRSALIADQRDEAAEFRNLDSNGLDVHAIQAILNQIELARLGTISFDAVRHLLLCRIERRPPRLDMGNYPHLPLAQVRTTQAADYMTLLVEVCA
jgi:hypothetical protein